ncbi:iron-containing alcohol dehydrogenase [bacterium]|nr:iron-containing alcohol dehydrogenase [bacterium]
MRFGFAAPARILFGPGEIEKAGSIAAGLGNQWLVICGRSRHGVKSLISRFEENGLRSVLFPVSGEPDIEGILSVVKEGRKAECDAVAGIGGGSVLDTAKAVAALLANPGYPMDYLEVVGKGQPLTAAPLPCIAIPTTAGTGAEATTNAVIAVPERRVKVSLRSTLMLPAVALVDPVLSHTLPPAVTASTGLDALTQLIEPFVCRETNPLVDGLCREGIGRIARSLFRAFRNGSDADAREDMALASLFSGMALANAKLGAVHGFAGPLGGMFPVPHGVACARLLPHVMRMNIGALRSRDPYHPSLERYREVARLLTGLPDADAEQAAIWVEKTVREMQIPALQNSGLSEKDFTDVAAKARKASSMKGNPIELTDAELLAILESEKNFPG